MLQHVRRAWWTWPLLAWPFEVVSIGLGYACYAVVRVIAPQHRTAAFRHAEQVQSTEHWFHLDVEARLNQVLALHPAWGTAAAWWYALGHFGVTPVVLVGLWIWRRPAYPALRSALVLASASALAVYASWPLAPPWYAVPDADDVLLDQRVLGGSVHGVSGLVNDLAAMPSLHVGWAAWVALVVVTTGRSTWRYLAWLYPLVTTLVVMASANHYLLDAVAGAGVVLAAHLLTRPQALRAERVPVLVRVRQRNCPG